MIHEYLDAVKAIIVTVPNNIFLLTDDQNAIEEAEAKFPEKNWMYCKRPRHRETRVAGRATLRPANPNRK